MNLKYKKKSVVLFLIPALGLGTNLCGAISPEIRKDPLLPKINRKEIRPHSKTVHSILDNLQQDMPRENELFSYEMARKEKEPPKTSVMIGDYGKYSFGLGKGCSHGQKCNNSPENSNGPSLAVPLLFIKGDNRQDIPAVEIEQSALHS